jgi:hypothetical protein
VRLCEVLLVRLASLKAPSPDGVVVKRDPMMASVKESNDQNEPAPACNSVPICSGDEQINADSELQIEETTSGSLIENWIDA